MKVIYKIRFEDGEIFNVVRYQNADWVLGNEGKSMWPLSEFDIKDYEIIEEGDENEDELS